MRNSFAKEDQISHEVIKKACLIDKKYIISHYIIYLSIRYHQLCFKKAILCEFLKSRKRNRSIPRSYHLIALLSCLEKVLKCVVARRIIILVLKTMLFSNLNFGAVLGRSALNPVAMLIYNIKNAIKGKNGVSALEFDIKKAFDIIRNKLIKQLLNQ